jgi:hypothetical protein
MMALCVLADERAKGTSNLVNEVCLADESPS